MKYCSKCKIEKDEREFHKNKSQRDGLDNWCKVCSAEKKAKYYQSNIEEIKKKCLEYRAKNKDKMNIYQVKYYQATKVDKHKYYIVNKEKILNRQANATQEVKDKKRQYNVNYHIERRKTDSLYNLQHRTGSLIRGSMKAKGYTKKSKTAKLIGCPFEQFMDWLGPKPCENPQLDHMCPMAQAKTEDEANKLQHYMNFQWLTPEENLKKSDNKTYAGEFLCQILLGREWEDSCNSEDPVV
jgi:hypothetical protein